jgi:hypothetical protein
MAKPNGEAAIEIAGPADLRCIGPIHKRLLVAFDDTGAILIDLSRAEDTDIALIQVIEATRRAAASAARPCRLATPIPGELADQLERGGFVARPEDRAFWFGTTENR